MKTISKKSIEKKVIKLVENKEISINSIVYLWLIELINGRIIFRPVYSQGSSWKYSTLRDRRAEFTKVLISLGLEYESGNDAPRGGKTGAFVKIITKIK